MKTPPYLIYSAIAGLLITGGVVWEKRSTAQAVLFYKTALQEVGISEPAVDFETVRNTYARTLLSRNPQFGIAGVNVNSLRTNINSLEELLHHAAALQTNYTDTKNLLQLYPTGFLRLLADTEEARGIFILSGNSDDLHAYEQTLTQMLYRGKRDARYFRKTLKEYLAQKGSFSISGPTGTVSRDDMQRQSELIETRMQESIAKFIKRKACFAGKVSQCDTNDLAQELPADILPQTGNYALAQDIIGLRKTALPTIPVGNLVLQSSVCMGEPSYFLAHDSSPILVYVGDILFRSTRTTQGPMNQYLLTSRDITYTYLNPLQFYICPHVLADMSLSRAIQETYTYAKQNNIAIPSSYAAPTQAMNERDAVAYVRTWNHSLPTDVPDQNEQTLLLRMWRERSAGLEYLIQNIASTTQTDLLLKNQGAPFDLNAATLFVTHAAFPSLFLMHNKSAGQSTYYPPTSRAKDRNSYYEPLLRYSTADTATRRAMAQNLTLFFRFESILP